jgi:hypothetical protein
VFLATGKQQLLVYLEGHVAQVGGDFSFIRGQQCFPLQAFCFPPRFYISLTNSKWWVPKRVLISIIVLCFSSVTLLVKHCKENSS